MLKIVVCIKAVPDPKEADKIRIDPVTRSLKRHDVPLVLNTLDGNAMEAAVTIKEQTDARVTVISMGPPAAEHVVKECLARGADQGILISDQAFAGSDAFATAFILAKAVEKVGEFDAIFCGMASSDGATEWVGPELATLLNIPVVTMVTGIMDMDGTWWKVKADVEEGYRLVQVRLPAVFTITRDHNIPRNLSFSGILKARKKEILTWDANALQVSEEDVGLKGSPTIVSKMSAVHSSRNVEMLQGTREEKAALLLRKLIDYGIMG
jgi:electron transfer flavoprotein alpha/beta subunit